MWYRQQPDGIMVQVRVATRARQNAIIGVTGDFLKISVTAVPERGKANVALKQLLSDIVQVRPAQIRILKGANASTKQLLVPGTISRLIQSIP